MNTALLAQAQHVIALEDENEVLRQQAAIMRAALERIAGLPNAREKGIPYLWAHIAENTLIDADSPS